MHFATRPGVERWRHVIGLWGQTTLRSGVNFGYFTLFLSLIKSLDKVAYLHSVWLVESQ